MKIVIDIPVEVYKSIQGNDYCGISNADMYNAVKNGTPLPKNHGRLIDADKLKMTTITRWNGDVDFVVYKEELDNAPTVIESEEEE